MARFPGAKWRPLPENASQPKIVPTQLIFHSAVDAPGPTDLYKYFGRTDVVEESHFWIPLDGSAEQFIDTEIMADANYHANRRAISAETEDEGNPDIRPWTPAQLIKMKELAVWAHATHGVPLVPCTSWDSPGIGYHSMWGFTDNRNLTGPVANPWSPAFGKTCPGRIRVQQFWNEFIPSLTKDAPMNRADAETLVRASYKALLLREPDAGGFDYWVTQLVNGLGREDFFWAFLIPAADEIAARWQRITALETAVNQLSGQLSELSKSPVAVDIQAVVTAIAKKLAA